MIFVVTGSLPFSAKTTKKFLVVSEYFPSFNKASILAFLFLRLKEGSSRKLRILESFSIAILILLSSASTFSSVCCLEAAPNNAVA